LRKKRPKVALISLRRPWTKQKLALAKTMRYFSWFDWQQPAKR